MFGGKIKRYNIFVMLSCLMGIAIGGLCVAYLFVPVLSLSYVEGGITTNVSVSGFDLLKNLFDRLVLGKPTELGNQFFTFIVDTRKTSLNQLQTFLVTGINGKLEHIIILIIGFFLLLSVIIGLVTTIISIVSLIIGRLHFTSIVKKLAKLFFSTFTTLSGFVIGTYFLYSDLIKAVVNSTENTVTSATINGFYLSAAYLVIALAILILSSIFYKIGLEDKKFVR